MTPPTAERTVLITIKARHSPSYPTVLFCSLQRHDLEQEQSNDLVNVGSAREALDVVAHWLAEVGNNLATPQ